MRCRGRFRRYIAGRSAAINDSCSLAKLAISDISSKHSEGAYSNGSRHATYCSQALCHAASTQHRLYQRHPSSGIASLPSHSMSVLVPFSIFLHSLPFAGLRNFLTDLPEADLAGLMCLRIRQLLLSSASSSQVGSSRRVKLRSGSIGQPWHDMQVDVARAPFKKP